MKKQSDRNTTRSRWIWWTLTVACAVLIFATLPLTPKLVAATNRLFPVSYAVNTAMAFLLSVVIVMTVALNKKGRFWALVSFFVYVSLLMIGIMKMKLPVERIHIVEYGILSLLVYRSFRIDRPVLMSYRLSFFLVSLIGMMDEAAQLFIPGRFFAWSDMFANIAGGMAGLILCGFHRWLRTPKTET